MRVCERRMNRALSEQEFRRFRDEAMFLKQHIEKYGYRPDPRLGRYLEDELPSAYVFPYEDPFVECMDTHEPPSKAKAKRKTKGNSAMNYSTAVMLINPNIRAIKCSYEPAAKEGQTPASYIFKTLDPTIKVGDYVVVPTDTRWKMTVNRVEEADVEVDFDSDVQLKWILGRVDLSDINKIQADEQKAIDIIKRAEARKKREDIRNNLEALKTEELQTLAIAKMGEPAAIEGAGGGV
jgi:hypothetical protein